MKIKLLAVGSKMPSWVEQGVKEYLKRMPREFQVELLEIPLAQRSKTNNALKCMELEGKALLAKVAAQDHVVALEVKGKSFSTSSLARRCEKFLGDGRDVCVLIGGPDGLAETCRRRADEQWSLSELTLPHPIVRLLVVEQLYRAWSVIQGHPYHRE